MIAPNPYHHRRAYRVPYQAFEQMYNELLQDLYAGKLTKEQFDKEGTRLFAVLAMERRTRWRLESN